MKGSVWTIAPLAVGLVVGSSYAGGIRWNMTPSMPLGLYRVKPIQSAVSRGEVVTLCLEPEPAAFGRERGYLTGGECPNNVELLIKTVVAIPGDEVKVSDNGLSVNDIPSPHSKALSIDDLGRSIQAVETGTYSVGKEQVWVIGDCDPRSYDSRYYGAVPIENLRGRAIPLFVN